MEIFNGICQGVGVPRAINVFQKGLFVKTIQNHSLTVKTCIAHSLGFMFYTYSSLGDHEYG